MNLNPLLSQIKTLPAYRELLDGYAKGWQAQPALGLQRSTRPLLAAALASDLQQPVLYLVPRVDRVLTLAEEFSAWAPHVRVLTFPEPNPLFYEIAPWNAATIRRRVQVLATLTLARQPGSVQPKKTEPVLILSSAKALLTRSLPLRTFIRNSRWLQTGRTYDQMKLVQQLVDIGYTHESIVVAPGQFSRRGGIVDMWPPAEPLPIRIEYFGDEIESLRSFQPATQRSEHVMDHVRLTPAREALPALIKSAWEADILNAFEEPPDSITPFLEQCLPRLASQTSGLLSYLPSSSAILVEDQAALEDAILGLEEQAVTLRQQLEEEQRFQADPSLPYLTLEEVRAQLDEQRTLDLGIFSNTLYSPIAIADHFQPGPRYGGQLRKAMEDILEKHVAGDTVILVSRQSQRLSELWCELGESSPASDGLADPLLPGSIHFIQGAMTEGWTLSRKGKPRLHLLTDTELFGWSRPKPRRRPTRVTAAPESLYADLNPGDLVVHIDYGIGRFAGLVARTLDDIQREFLLIEFQGGDELFVPIHQADRISRYIGTARKPPTLSKLGTQEWIRSRRKAEKATEEVARDLLELYALRQTIEGFSYAADTQWQQELEASFPFHETEDQIQALQDVKKDLESSRPMDRLICGDVGYGKTEVALRAAFKAVMNGKQVAFLVPTTVLAQQHYQTFLRRLAAFPVQMEMLSRFRSQAEVRRILQRLADGDVDIVIGTHRLLQKDVLFKDLGLLIVDEEQRFGVTHKEFLKQMRTEVDVLTLTATPIPRTLYLALTGARDISTIDTPPEERLPVITHAGTYNPRLVRQAILRELERGGQVYFVHNRVQTITGVHKQLEVLVPEATFAIAHGQMREDRLAQTMDRFHAGEIDVMVSTSIIESGLDIPNANTLIIDRADMFGLSQLYQLRGRVGRGAQQAYAYFFLHPRFRATEEARRRLEILAENTRLGSGFTIAMHDLEMRGAGDILGVRQHGHITAIGFHLYTRLLTQAITRMKHNYQLPTSSIDDLPQSIQALPVSLDIPLNSAIPPSYVPDQVLRLKLYRRLADQRSLAELKDVADEMHDRFGSLPDETRNLIFQMRMKLHAAKAGISSINNENGQFLLQMNHPPATLPREKLSGSLRQSKRGLWYRPSSDLPWADQLETLLLLLGKEKPARDV